jgi:hypothetical protein
MRSEAASSDQGEEHEHYGNTHDCECDGFQRRVIRVGLRQDVARSDVEQEAGEDAQVDQKTLRRNVHEKGDGRTDEGGGGVKGKEPERFASAVAVGEHQRDRVHPVGEVMGNDRDSDREADGGSRLEAKPDRDAVRQAVPGQRERRRDSDGRTVMVVFRVFPLVGTVDQQSLLDDVEAEETADESDHRRHEGGARRLAESRDLGEQVEGHDRQDDTGTEPQDKVKSTAIPKREQAPERGRKERAKSKKKSHT